MDQLKKLLGGLSSRQLMTIGVTVLLSAIGLFSLLHWRKESDFKLLYSGLAAEDSGTVVQKLKESGVEYRLSDAGDAISVPSAKLAELRLQLAAAGLPKSGRIGFEIFDKTNLGATEFVEHVNYRRALEGELERSITSLSEVEQARVHLTFPKESVFVENREPAKGSAMVKLRPGARLSPKNVLAIQHLVSSAVEGLSPDAVSVLDMQSNLLSRPAPASADEAQSDAALEYRQKVEHDLLQKISGTLDPVLGRDHYRASLSVDVDLTSAEQSEETVDPVKSVMLQSQKTEEIVTGGISGGVPGTASNLPRPASRPGGSGTSTTKRTENISWQPSKVTKTTKLPQGGLKRMSVAVLLDQTVKWEGTGKNIRRAIIPPSTEVLKSVRDLVAAATGFVSDRGDVITIETLPFEETLNQQAPEPVSAAPTGGMHSDPISMLKNLPLPAIVGLVATPLILLFVIFALTRKLRKMSRPRVSVGQVESLPPSSPKAIEPVDAEAQLQAQIAERDEEQRKADLAALATIRVPPVKTKKAEVLAKQIRETTKKDSSVSANVLQAWIHER